VAAAADDADADAGTTSEQMYVFCDSGGQSSRREWTPGLVGTAPGTASAAATASQREWHPGLVGTVSDTTSAAAAIRLRSRTPSSAKLDSYAAGAEALTSSPSAGGSSSNSHASVLLTTDL